ncbi:DUF3145 domain-containing protein [Rhodococcus sp. NPDC019627]|uniref:DUF3145 domain-containing protein n=1 Tax=Rhodococcus TaxID=1827 RepID=UPI00131FB1F8|nr:MULTISPECIES: DUF3145 domain-containing protein [Rhodococcus]MDV7355041.1 DUF3145 domain-containing protein [Rhodococcus oxybenzonivorans]QHE68975.1 hypothetical protein GFS60_02526 [Rhodococcus sp. WAY2]
MRALDQFADATAGVVYIHSSPAALCPHIEWALTATLDCPPNLKWTSQPASKGVLRATTSWVGPVGTASRLVNALRAWPMLRFEVTEDASEGVDGERYSHVPGMGLWHGSTSANGDVVVGEMRLRALMEAGGDLAAELDYALGTAWDEELEPYRSGGEGGEVTWLRREVG